MNEYNFYALLGVPQNATKEEILKKYKELATIYHPDKAGGSGFLFKTINHARDILLDPRKRAVHDRHIKDNFGKFTQNQTDSSKELTKKVESLIQERKQLKIEIDNLQKIISESSDTNYISTLIQRIQSISVENNTLNQKIQRVSIENTALCDKAERIEKDNKSLFERNEGLSIRINYLNSERQFRDRELEKENVILKQKIKVREESIASRTHSNKEANDKLVSDYKVLFDKHKKLEDEHAKLSTKKLTSEGCSMILFSVLSAAIGVVWLTTGNKNAGIAALIVSVILFFVGYRGR